MLILDSTSHITTNAGITVNTLWSITSIQGL
ncbi:MAG: hypothetical protein ACI87E_005093, partial [Mariniblastus sp.]